MSTFASLVRLYFRDLIRRRFVWALLIILIGVVAVNYATQSTMEEAMGRGESYDLATRRAASHLEQLAALLRSWVYVAVILLAAQVAPESRRNGTTQFVLSQGVSRDRLAAAQFCALSLLITVGALLLHVGFAVAGLRAEAVGALDAALGWSGLFIPLIAIAAAVFAVSLSSSAIESYLVFFGVPFLTQTLPDYMRSLSKDVPMIVARLLDNAGLLVPWFEDLSPWPHLQFSATRAAPHPELGWHFAHVLSAMAFWILLGAWRHRHHDFGSRTAVK